MKVFYTTCNNGDGSSSTEFFESSECITRLEDKDPEGYGQGEGGGSFEVPDGTVIVGIEIKTMADVDEQLSAMAE